MKKCPKCKEQIENLTYECSATNSWGGTFDGKKHEQDWDSSDSDDLVDNQENNVEYKCPECEEVLFTNEKEAKKFLGD